MTRIRCAMHKNRSGKQTTPVHLNLATKVFRGKHTRATIKVWIEEVRFTSVSVLRPGFCLF